MYTNFHVIYYIVIIDITSNIISLFCSNKLDHVDNDLNTKNLTEVTTTTKHHTTYNDNNKEITDILNHTHTYDVSSSYSKWLSESKIISGSLLQLQETIGQGIVNSYV